MTFSNPRNTRDAAFLARSLLGKPTYSWSHDRALRPEEVAGTTIMVPESFIILEPDERERRYGRLGNVKLRARFSYDSGRTWLNSPEDWYMVSWSFQTVEDWRTENP